MADGLGFGGNAHSDAGKITLSGTPQKIPIPNVGTFLPGTARLLVTAPANEDAYIGPVNKVVFRIPANTTTWFTVSDQLYVTDSTGLTPSSSSSSSSSSSTPVGTNVATYFYEFN